MAAMNGGLRPPLPLEGLRRRRAMWLFGGLALILFLVQAVLDLRLREHGASGVIPFEVAGTPGRAREILDQWGSARRDTARLGLAIDYPFLVSNALFFSLACAAVAAWQRRARLAAAGAAAAWAALFAGGADAVENVALLRILAGHTDQPWPAIARSAATVKFALSGLVLLYLIAGLIARHFDRRRQSE